MIQSMKEVISLYNDVCKFLVDYCSYRPLVLHASFNLLPMDPTYEELNIKHIYEDFVMIYRMIHNPLLCNWWPFSLL